MTDPDRLIFVATSDVAGKTRGKAFPAADLAARRAKGVGWTPTNVMITCFDTIPDGPFGALGDLVLVPDETAGFEAVLPGATGATRMMLGDVRTLDGAAWDCCTRSLLKGAIARLDRVAGLSVTAAFEHEFQFKSGDLPGGEAYGFQGFAPRRAFGEALGAALRAADITPDTFMKEYGPNQYEITVAPADALRAADEAVMLRELTRLTARALGETATFTPIRDPASVGNGVHVHMSLRDRDGRPATWSPDGPGGLSQAAGAFAAGILRHLPDLLALTAPSDISYLRLTPHRWSAAYNNLGFRDREAALRICPVAASDPASIARQFNLEYRAADGAASPHLALAALIHAGAQGIEEGLTPPAPTQEDLSTLSPEALAARGLARLPQSLAEALDRFAAAPAVRGWFPAAFSEVFLAHKAGEIAALGDASAEARCAAYEAVY
ncbi:MAG: glutamine synthetase family protein [Pseudomonadota bacterium]